MSKLKADSRKGILGEEEASHLLNSYESGRAL